jgi:uncharacterized protein YndB with AHSA1/START domain
VNRTIEIAPVRKSVVVDASPPQAFAVFTSGINRWWPKNHGIGASPLRESVIEPFVGGRWFTRHEDGSDVVIGHVRVWQPAERLVVSWEIEMRFIAEAGGRTRVELEHRNFERLGAAAGEKMRKDVDGGWPYLLDLYARDAAKKETKS